MKSNRIHQLTALAAVLGLTVAVSSAATIVAGNVNSTLGPDFFINNASTGGSDYNATTGLFRRDFGTLDVGSEGSQITISGIAWASPLGGTLATTVTLTVIYLGLDGVGGGGDDVVMGTRTDTLNFTGASTYVWLFDEPIIATIDGLNSFFRLDISGSDTDNNAANIRYKTLDGQANATGTKLSVAGTSLAVIPEPATALLGSLGLLALLRRRRS